MSTDDYYKQTILKMLIFIQRSINTYNGIANEFAKTEISKKNFNQNGMRAFVHICISICTYVYIS